MKGIVLAGGAGTRLWPATRAVSKQLLPVWDKPMIFYPLTTLMLAGAREILVITAPDQQPAFRDLLGDGSALGLDIAYAVQERPAGIAQALLIGEAFLAGQGCALVLGDNLFHGDGLQSRLAAARRHAGATVFVHPVRDPQRYGVLALDAAGRPLEIVEKPARPPSNLAVTGLYLYDADAPKRAAALKPSPRGELEITDLNRLYLEDGLLSVQTLGRGCAWLDTGTPASLLQAAQFVQALEERQGLKIGCPEETAYRLGLIDAAALARRGAACPNEYGRYLAALAAEAATSEAGTAGPSSREDALDPTDEAPPWPARRLSTTPTTRAAAT